MKVGDIWEVTEVIFRIVFYGPDYIEPIWLDDLDTENFAFDAALECEVWEIDVEDNILIVHISKDEFDAIQLTMMTNAVEPDFNSDYPKDLVSGDITT